MTKARLRVIIGENIRNERIARDISIDELSEMLDLTPGFVGLIERGQRGTTSSTLYRLSEVFDMPIDVLFRNSKVSALAFGEEPSDADAIKRKKITSFISGFSEEELEFILGVIKGLRRLRNYSPEGDFENIFGE